LTGEKLTNLAGEDRDVISRTGLQDVRQHLRTPFDLCQLLAPGGAVPDLEAVVDSCHDDFPAQLRVLDQLGGNHHAALFVELGLGGPRRRSAVEPAAFRAERIQRGQSRLDESIPIRTTVGVETAVEPLVTTTPSAKA
jgi:hypothetical protein